MFTITQNNTIKGNAIDFISMLSNNTIAQPKAKPSNNACITLLEQCDNTVDLTVEKTRSNSDNIANRGRLFAKALKLALATKYDYKYNDNFNYLDYKALPYELKRYIMGNNNNGDYKRFDIVLSNSFACGSYDIENSDYVIFYNNKELKLIATCDLELNTSGKIKAQQTKGRVLEKLQEVLGL